MSELSAARAGTIKLGDFNVNRLGYGAMRLSGKGIWGEPADREQAKATLKEAVKLGVNFIDTADSYGPEVSENIIAETLKPYSGLLIATKGGKTRPGPDIWHNDCSREHLREAIAGSLKRLGLERIDLYQLHAVDINVSFRESMRALVDLKNEGKIRHIGISNVSPDELEVALGMTEIVSVQNRFNVLERENEDVLRICEQNGIAFITYWPLAGGKLVRPNNPLTKIAQKYGVSTSQIAIAWLLKFSKFTLPIPGTSSFEHLRDNIAAANVELNDGDMAELNNL